MRKYQHLSTRYVYDRIRVLVDNKISANKPWLTAESVRLLNNLLSPDDEMLEVGSGKSTLWFAERVALLHSLEDNQHWFNKVTTLLNRNNFNQTVKYELLAADETYSQKMTSLDKKYDVILVDAGDRGKCALQSLKMVRANGILIIDNANWYLPSPHHAPESFRNATQIQDPDWLKFYDSTSHLRCIQTTNGIADTFIYFAA